MSTREDREQTLVERSDRWQARAVAAESRVADLQAENARLREMVVCFYDPSPCWFDHHGGCQAHGFLDLEAGETCPNEEARALVGDETPGTGDGA